MDFPAMPNGSAVASGFWIENSSTGSKEVAASGGDIIAMPWPLIGLTLIGTSSSTVRIVCIQFRPDRVRADEARVRRAFREAFPDAEVVVGEDDGRYENMKFEVASPHDAMSKVLEVLDSPEVGRVARYSCIVTCQGEHGWDDYLLLHHFDRTLVLDEPAARSAK